MESERYYTELIEFKDKVDVETLGQPVIKKRVLGSGSDCFYEAIRFSEPSISVAMGYDPIWRDYYTKRR